MLLKILKLIYFLGFFVIFNGKNSYSLQLNYTLYTPSNYKFKTSTVPLIRTQSKISGKWQVGRVSRKQYEIINMLYRKTKTFVEVESATPDINKLTKYRNMFNKNNQHITLATSKPIQESFQVANLHSKDRRLTPSYIEFYYLDESNERIKRKDSILKSSHTETEENERKFALLRPPFFLFRVNDETCKPTIFIYIKSSILNNIQLTKPDSKSSTLLPTVSQKKITKNNIQKPHENKHLQSEYKPRISVNKTEVHHKTNITGNKSPSSLLRNVFTTSVPTTPYDRIKFFEIYDSDTHKPPIPVNNNRINMINDNYIQSEEKIYLDQVDHDTSYHNSHNVTRFVKKHVSFDINENKNINVESSKNNILKPVKITKTGLSRYNRPAKWSEFPFIGVYVYEPKQVRCDSASISPHWLVASATCLYHEHNDLTNQERSAFVSYCGDNWRLPGRIGYVKRSFVHPRFRPNDITRKYLYNMGVIQVVNSMATTCSGWRPISLMSHQFVADRDGAFATAIGWGLDRYETRYSSSDLPTYPLMLYEGHVHSDSCPGNTDYSKVRSLNEDSVKNIYCLSLPTYTSEENDTVHGSLLLIGGKLIALYLQEERRSWGEQSAQYTGVWRLIPWLLDIAREEDLETVASDI